MTQTLPPSYNLPVRKKFAWIITTLGAALYVFYSVLDFIGVLQTAQGIFQNRSTVLRTSVLVLTSPWLPLGLFLLGVAALIYIYKAPRIEKGRVKLDLLTKPKRSTSDKLSIACDPTVEGCIKLNRWEAGPVNFLRISVKTDSVEPITNCKAFLTRIEKNEEKKWGDHSPQLTFSEGEDPDALAKTVYNKVPAFIDVLALTSWGEIRPGTKNRIWPFMPRMHEIFSEVGDYVLTVVITGDGAEPITALLKFNSTRNWQTSWLTLIPESSIQSPGPPQSWAISYEQETEMLEILNDSPKAAVMIMSTKEDRVGNRYAMRLVQVLRKTGMEIGQCVFDESWRLPTGVNLWASDFADNRQISKLRAAIKATNMECGDAPREPPTVSSPTRYEIDIMVKSSRETSQLRFDKSH